jgi:hypothetical protein
MRTVIKITNDTLPQQTKETGKGEMSGYGI